MSIKRRALRNWGRRTVALGVGLAGLLVGNAQATVHCEAWYHLGENTLPQDASGHGRHFQKTGPGYTYASTDSAGGPLGDSGFTSTTSLEFGREGQSGFVDIGYTPPNDNVGIEAWVKPIGPGCIGPLGWVLSTGEYGGINISVVDQTCLRAGLVYKNYVGDSVPIDVSRWTHVAVVRDQGVTTFYVNGIARGSTSAVPNPASTVHLGGAAENFRSAFRGLIDEARIFTFAPGEFSTSDLLLRSGAASTHAAGQTEDVPDFSYLLHVWQSDAGLPQNTVTAITQTPDGYLWVGTLGGLARLDGVAFRVFTGATTPALGSGRIEALAVGRRGALRITTVEGDLVRFS